MALLKRALLDGSFLLDLPEQELPAVIRRGLDYVVAQGALAEERRDEVEQQLLERERVFPTAIGNTIAIPHVYTEAVVKPMTVFIRLRHPINLGAPDGRPIRFVFLLVGPPDAVGQHLDVLANIARLTSDADFRYEAGIARTQLDLLAALEHFHVRNEQADDSPVQTADDGLAYSGRLGGGLIGDIKRRAAVYASDFTDGLNFKSVASVLFLFFACLAPAITFGGVMAELTENHIGIVEMLLATALGGVIYAMFAGQPLILLGGTVPMLVFTWVLYVLCQQVGLEEYFLETYACTGIWTSLILIGMAVFEASGLMRFVTRFTDEIFGALMSIVYIYVAVQKMMETVSSVYEEQTVRHDEALVPLLLAGTTFAIAFTLSRVRKSRYLLPTVREFLADFGPAIAIGISAAMAIAWFSDVTLKTLEVHGALSPTFERSWLINPFRAPVWVWFASIGPAILAALLIYIVQNLTARIINSPQNNLQKGPGYHLDLAVLGGLVGIASLFGMPWLAAATVRSLNMVRGLSKMEEVMRPDGTISEKIIHVHENRVTPLAIHVLIGGSLLFLNYLQHIPLSVLLGLFLYMGIVSLGGNQFVERTGLLLTDPRLYPTTHYIRRVPRKTIHIYTIVQVVCLVLLTFASFERRTGILLPLLLVLLIPIRMLVAKFIPAQHMEVLDSSEDPDEEEDHWI